MPRERATDYVSSRCWWARRSGSCCTSSRHIRAEAKVAFEIKNELLLCNLFAEVTAYDKPHEIQSWLCRPDMLSRSR